MTYTNPVIIYTDPSTNELVELNPNLGAFTIEEVIAADVPSGVTHFINERELLPDDTFRDAWEVNSAGNGVIENLASCKTIALERIRAAAKTALQESEKDTLLGETPQYSTTVIRDAFTTAKNNINAATSPSQIKSLFTAFVTAYHVASEPSPAGY